MIVHSFIWDAHICGERENLLGVKKCISYIFVSTMVLEFEIISLLFSMESHYTEKPKGKITLLYIGGKQTMQSKFNRI